MSERRLIALDIDGTIVVDRDPISPRVIESVRALVERGDIVTLATGRAADDALPVLAELGIAPEYVVAANGACVLRRDSQAGEAPRYTRYVVETFDPAPALRQLRPHLTGASYAVETRDGEYLFAGEQFPHEHFRAVCHEVPFERLLEEAAVRVVVVSPNTSDAEFNEVVNGVGLKGVSYAIGWTAWLDIAPYGVNKGTALERVRRTLGVDPAAVTVVGDGRNDIEMLQWAAELGGQAVAMGQAGEELRAVANRLTGTYSEDGLGAMLAELVDGRG